MTAAFCEFVLDFAGFASNKKVEFLNHVTNRATEAYKNLFGYLSPSDIAWALMIYIDKEDDWKKPTTARTNKRRRTDVVPDKLWTKVPQSRMGSVGLSKEACAFYSVFKTALKEIPIEDWEEVWTGFWSDYLKDKLVQSKKCLSQDNS